MIVSFTGKGLRNNEYLRHTSRGAAPLHHLDYNHQMRIETHLKPSLRTQFKTTLTPLSHPLPCPSHYI